MKDIGKEIIEIGGKEYTLILNRKGIVAWEKFAKKEKEEVVAYNKKVQKMSMNEEKIEKDTNPFEGLEGIDELDENQEALTLYFQKLYWIMLYETHKFNFEEAQEIYNLACEEYGEVQVIQLGTQMLEEANIDKYAKKENLKNLKALKPAK